MLFNYAKALFKYVSPCATLAAMFVIINIWIGQPVPLYTLIVVMAFVPMMTAYAIEDKDIAGRGYNDEI